MAVHTPDQLRELLVTLLSGATGKPAAHWRSALGEVEMLPLATNVLSNWRISPKAGKRDLAAIAQAVELVRAQHPYVARDGLRG